MNLLTKSMKYYLTSFFQTLSNLGIDENTTSFNKLRYQLVNQVIILSVLLFIISIIYSAALLELSALLFNVALMGLTAIPLYLNYLKKQQAANIYFCLLTPISLVSIIVLFDTDNHLYYGFIIYSVFLVIFFSSLKSRILYSLYLVSAFCLMHWYRTQYPIVIQIDERIEILGQFTFFFGAFFFILFFVKRYTELLKRSLRQTENMFKTQLEKQQIIEKQNLELQYANEELEKFAYIASHDLKSPLRNINNYLGLIKRNIKRGKKEGLLDDLNYAQQASTQMHTLIEDILNYSRMGKQELSFEPVKVNSVMRSVIRNMETTLQEKNAKVQYNLHTTIEANATQFALLLQNLIQNGIKYNESAIPTIEVKEEIIENTHIIISIKDNGIGIPAEHQQEVFEMFARLHTQKDYEGTGLGLAICKRIVTVHNGAIWLESEKGTTFYVELPIKQPKECIKIKTEKTTTFCSMKGILV